MPAGVAVLNGAGEMTSALAIQEWGLIESTVYLTSTMAVGRVFDGAVAGAVAAEPPVGVEEVVIPVVAECDDGLLNHARLVQVDAADAGRALADSTAGEIAQEAVGRAPASSRSTAKGGIGTASRVAGGATVGTLVSRTSATDVTYGSTACQSAGAWR